MINKLEKNYLIFVLVIGLFGIISAYLLQEVWEGFKPDLILGFQVLFFYLFSLYIFFLIGFSKTKIERNYFSLSRIKNLLFLDLIYFVFILFSFYNYLNIEYLYQNTGGLRFGTLINSVLIITPVLHYSNIKNENKYYCYFLIFLSILVLFLSKTRFNIIYLIFLLIIISGKNFFNVRFIISLFLILILSIIYRSEDTVNELFSNDFFIILSSLTGSEFRDGISLLNFFSINEIENIKSNYFKTLLIPILPGWSFLGIIDPNELRENLIAVKYSQKLRLDEVGITGIRVGLVWEFFLLYKYFGITLLAFINFIFFKIYSLINEGDLLKVLFSILMFIPFYSFVGQTNMVFSIPFNLFFYSIFFLIISQLPYYNKK